MSEYMIYRIITVSEYEKLKDINQSFIYSFSDGDRGTVILNKLLISDVASITHNNITAGIEVLQTNYRKFHDDYITGIEIDEVDLTIPIKERSFIVFGKLTEA
jgi:hypothetical protein